jgi:glucose-1-phosphate adenylyltransferase
MVLAGGRGTRLAPLTDRRAKPAVPFAAKFRIIDFALNNFVNSGVYAMYLLTQFRAQSLTEHVQRNWRFGNLLHQHFISLVPAQMYRYEELGPVWYRGTADAVYQNAHLIHDFAPETVAIFGGDHVFKMDLRPMIAFHRDSRADLTLAGYPVPIEEAKRFGVLEVDKEWRLVGFEEKPEQPKPIPGRPDMALVSMGNYLFKTSALHELLDHDARNETSEHDFGMNVIPLAAAQGYHVRVYDFLTNRIPGQIGKNTYWRDIGTLDAYFEASMDLINVVPEFDLYNPKWPLRTATMHSPPTKFVHESGERRGRALNSLLAGGVIVSGGTVRESVVSRRVRVNSFADVYRSVIFAGTVIGRHSRINKAIIDKGVVVPPGTEIGFDPEEDAARGFTITPGGVTVVPKGYVFQKAPVSMTVPSQ